MANTTCVVPATIRKDQAAQRRLSALLSSLHIHRGTINEYKILSIPLGVGCPCWHGYCLFNVQTDRAERHEISATNPKIVKSLLKRLKLHKVQVQALDFSYNGKYLASLGGSECRACRYAPRGSVELLNLALVW